MIEFGVSYPATTPPPPPSAPGLVVHSLYDISMYAGTDADQRYQAAGEDETARIVALQDMPKATVIFSELPEGEPYFADVPPGFFDQFPELEDDAAGAGRPTDEAPLI